MTAFDFNEEIKKSCILLGATYCYTQYIGNLNLPDAPFWYNVIILSPNINQKYFSAICETVDSRLVELEHFGFYDQTVDVGVSISGHKFIMYCLYYNKEIFFKKI